MKTIDFDKEKGPAYDAFLTIVSKRYSRKDFENLLASRKDGKNQFEFELKINGIEFDFEELFVAVNKQWDWQLKQEAIKQFESLFPRLDKIREVLEEAESKIKTEFNLHENECH